MVDKVGVLGTQGQEDVPGMQAQAEMVVLQVPVLNMEKVAQVVLPEYLDEPVDKSDIVTVTLTMATMGQQDILDKYKYNNLQWRHHDLGFNVVTGV